MLHLDPDKVYRSSLLEQMPGVRHGFGTRLSGDWLSGKCVSSLRQVHSNTVLVAEHAGLIGEGDALITAEPGLLVSVRTADCVPILLADPEHNVVAAVHSGWRGTAAAIVRRTVEAMAREFASHPERLLAAIGPSIGRCCYAVGPDVAAQFGTLFPEWDTLSQRRNLDLVQANWRQLIHAGLPAGNIDFGEFCTACGISLFESYRRDGEASGRMVSAIGLTNALD